MRQALHCGGWKESDEQSLASMNRDSVAFCVCKQTGVALDLVEFHSSRRKLIWSEMTAEVERGVLNGVFHIHQMEIPGQVLKSCREPH